MCNKAVDTSSSAIQFVSKCCKTQEICDKAADACTFVFYCIPDQYETQEICDKVVSKDPFMLNKSFNP